MRVCVCVRLCECECECMLCVQLQVHGNTWYTVHRTTTTPPCKLNSVKRSPSQGTLLLAPPGHARDYRRILRDISTAQRLCEGKESTMTAFDVVGSAIKPCAITLPRR